MKEKLKAVALWVAVRAVRGQGVGEGQAPEGGSAPQSLEAATGVLNAAPARQAGHRND